MDWEIVEFAKKYSRLKFDCEETVLNSYLQRQISGDIKRKANVPTLAVNCNGEVVGYYTLSSGAVEFKNFPQSLKNKMAPYPVPIARIGRLAVDKSMKGKGLGRELLFHAIDRSEKISKQLGIRAVVVDAKNLNAEKFYLKYGFQYLQKTKSSKSSLFLMI